MADNTIVRSPGLSLDASSVLIPMKSFPLQGYSFFCLQLIIAAPSADLNGEFQLMVSNNDGTNWSPVPDNGGFTYKVTAAGNTVLSYFIFAGPAGGVTSAQQLGLKWTRVAGTGTLSRVIWAGNTN